MFGLGILSGLLIVPLVGAAFIGAAGTSLAAARRLERLPLGRILREQ